MLVRIPYEDGWDKLVCMLNYLKHNKNDRLTLEVDEWMSPGMQIGIWMHSWQSFLICKVIQELVQHLVKHFQSISASSRA